jgi:glycosyltransferase involved in cell wall biosynthesis
VIEAPVRVSLVVPLCPKFHGNGLVMRAASLLKLLKFCGVATDLLIVNVFSNKEEEPEEEIHKLCRTISWIKNPIEKPASPSWIDEHGGRQAIPYEWQRYNESWQSDIKSALEKLQPDLIMVFRFWLVPFILPVVTNNTPVWLDVDELESTVKRRISRLYALLLSTKSATTDRTVLSQALTKSGELHLQAKALERLEARYLPSFHRIFCSSPVEQKNILAKIPGHEVLVLPNIYPRVRRQIQRQSDGKARLLMVGNYDYYPNRDGLFYFCQKILPALQSRSALPIELLAVGGGLESSDHRLLPDNVKVVGPVPDTTPYYADCDLAIVPLRAAGGTRIKILEAFSHERAVVSSAIGAEGLEVTTGRHLLIADSSEDFIEQCLLLIDDAEKRNAIAQQGHAFFKMHHSMDSLLEMVPQLFSGAISKPVNQRSGLV